MSKLYHLILAFILTSPALAFAATNGGSITACSSASNQINICFASSNGLIYQAQGLSNLGQRFWVDDGAAESATGQTDSAAGQADSSCGFFRVLEFTNSVFWYDWGYYYQQPTLSTWGLGSSQNNYAHNDRPYDWYIDQQDTGACANNNCGPSSVTMAIKWYDGSYTNTAEDARNTYYAGGGWWYTTDIINYLNLRGIPHTISAYTGSDQLMQILSESNIVILCINTAHLTRNTVSEQRVSRFYDYTGGHFLLVKGWRNVSGSVFFETYDPNNWHALYGDGTQKGSNRHLGAYELSQSIVSWWGNLIVIHPPGGGGGARLSRVIQPLDPKKIVHQKGR